MEEKNLTSSLCFHHQLRNQHLEPTFGLGGRNIVRAQWWATSFCSAVTSQPHPHTHTNISKKQIQKHVTICHVYKTSNSLSRQDWNHPIWQINAVDPSLVDVRNNYIQYQHEQIHALQNVCCLEKKWAATTSLPTVEFRANPQKLSFATRRVAPQSKTSVSIYLHHGWTSGAIFGPWAITG